MYICICCAVTEKDVKEMVAKGCRTLAHIEKACGAGAECGSCKFKLQQTLTSQDSQQDNTAKAV